MIKGYPMSSILTPNIVRRRRNRPITAFAVPLLVAVAACSRGSTPTDDTGRKDAGPRASAGGSDTSAKGMAGMPMPSAKEGGGARDSGVTLTAAQIRHGGVAWQPVEMGTAAASVAVPGQLVPNEDRTARLGAPGSGRVVKVHVRPGDRVSRGQLLVTVQSPEAGAAQSDLAKARAELSARQAQAVYAKTARERAERVVALKGITRQ